MRPRFGYPLKVDAFFYGIKKIGLKLEPDLKLVIFYETKNKCRVELRHELKFVIFFL